MATRMRIVLKMEKIRMWSQIRLMVQNISQRGKRNCFHSSVMHGMVLLECRIPNNSLHTHRRSNLVGCQKDQQILASTIWSYKK